MSEVKACSLCENCTFNPGHNCETCGYESYFSCKKGKFREEDLSSVDVYMAAIDCEHFSLKKEIVVMLKTTEAR